MRVQRKLLAGLLSLPLFAGCLMSPWGSGEASAQNFVCQGTNGGHCYAYAGWGSGGSGTPISLSEVGADIEVDCLDIAPYTTDFINYEQWMITNTNYNHPATTWVESGYTRGPLNADGQTYYGYNFFWADQRDPVGGSNYAEHYIQSFPTHQYVDIGFKWVPNTNNWMVFNNHYQVGTSVGVGAYAGGAQLGIEATDLRSALSGNTSNWRYKDGVNGTFHPAPQGQIVVNPTTSGMAATSSGGQTSAHTSNYCNYPPQPQAKSRINAPTADSALSQATSLAIELGGAAPTSTQSVETTRAAANRAVGSTVTSDVPVVMLQMEGNFSAGRSAKIPPTLKGPRPHGSVLTVVLDKKTGYLTDWILTDRKAGLGQLGAVRSAP